MTKSYWRLFGAPFMNSSVITGALQTAPSSFSKPYRSRDGRSEILYSEPTRSIQMWVWLAAACAQMPWTIWQWSHDLAVPLRVAAYKRKAGQTKLTISNTCVASTSAAVLSENTITFLWCNSFAKVLNPKMIANASMAMIWLSLRVCSFFTMAWDGLPSV